MTGSSTHVTETKSNNVLRSLLDPDRFLVREQSERDYGIDLLVECFGPGRQVIGRQLLVQLKGDDSAELPQDENPISFSIETTHLARAELFSVPELLVWVPTGVSQPAAWYLWVQEYIEVVLDQDPSHAGWREQGSKTLHIPYANALHQQATATERLQSIAAVPRRERAMLRLVGIASEASWHRDDPSRLMSLLQEALEVPEMSDEDWPTGVFLRSRIEGALDELSSPPKDEPTGLALFAALNSIVACAADERDVGLRWSIFDAEGSHRF